MTPGWMGMGFGTQMAGTEMVILWSNSDGTITISQRTATGESQPLLTNNPSRVASLSQDLSSTSGTIKFAFTIPANSDTNQNVIYAFGSQNPGSKDAGATLIEHIEHETGVLDLTKPLSSGSNSSGSNSTGTGSSSGSDSARSLTNTEKMIVAHGIICVVGFLLFLPAGALLARYLRTFTPTWFTGHWIVQFGLAGPFIIAGVALGIQSVNSVGGEHINDDHKKWGISIFILYFVQCALGAIIHFFKLKNFRGRPPQNYIHAVLGLLLIAFALKQAGSGIEDEWPAMTGRPVCNPAKIVWIVWCVLLPVLYFAGVAFLPRQFKQEKASRAKNEVNHNGAD